MCYLAISSIVAEIEKLKRILIQGCFVFNIFQSGMQIYFEKERKFNFFFLRGIFAPSIRKMIL